MQDANSIGAEGRYVIERVLGEQSAGRYVVAVDTLAGGRVTILLPSVQAARPQRVVDAVMQEIASRIQEGAMAFLNAEYRVIAVFVAVVAVLLGLSSIGN